MSASPRDGGPVIDPEDPTGPGAQLREARHRANLSLEEVATQLRLDRRTVRALEENEFQYLPAPTFIRGYIRSYARLLGLPPGPILDAYDYQGFNAPDLLADITQRPQARSTDIPVRLATYVVAAGLVAMVVMWWHSRESSPELPSEVEYVAGARDGDATATTGPSEDSMADGAESQQPPAPEPPAQELIAAENTPPAPNGSGDENAPAESGAVSEAPGAEAPAPAAPAQRAADTATAAAESPAPAARDRDQTVPVRDALVTALNPPERRTQSSQQSVAEPTPTSRLVIRFSQESWVEIFDADGIRREFRLATPGSRTSVGGTPPYHVLLGYAEGALVTFDGEDYDISRFIRGDTARFLIGPDGLKKARRPEPVETPSDSPPAPSEAAASQLPSDSAVPDAN